MEDRPPAYRESVIQIPPGGVYQHQPNYGTLPPPAVFTYPQHGNYAFQPQPGSAFTTGALPPHAGAIPPLAGTNVYNVTSTHTTAVPFVIGGCPVCRSGLLQVGILENDFTCLGVLCAVLFFPLGILFCFALRQRRCAHCGTVFG